MTLLSKPKSKAKLGGVWPYRLFTSHPPVAVLVVLMGGTMAWLTSFMARCITANPDLQPNALKDHGERVRHTEQLYTRYNVVAVQDKPPIPVVMKADGTLQYTDYSKFPDIPTNKSS